MNLCVIICGWCSSRAKLCSFLFIFCATSSSSSSASMSVWTCVWTWTWTCEDNAYVEFACSFLPSSFHSSPISISISISYLFSQSFRFDEIYNSYLLEYTYISSPCFILLSLSVSLSRANVFRVRECLVFKTVFCIPIWWWCRLQTAAAAAPVEHAIFPFTFQITIDSIRYFCVCPFRRFAFHFDEKLDCSSAVAFSSLFPLRIIIIRLFVDSSTRRTTFFFISFR